MGNRQQRSLEAKIADLRNEQRIHLNRLADRRMALADIVKLLADGPERVVPEDVRVLPAVADDTVRAVVEVQRLGLQIADLQQKLDRAGAVTKLTQAEGAAGSRAPVQ